MCKNKDDTFFWSDSSSDMSSFNTAAPDLCSEYNGGCHQNADCNQTGLLVNCTCHSGYQGDGFSCEPINRWVWLVVSSILNLL